MGTYLSPSDPVEFFDGYRASGFSKTTTAELDVVGISAFDDSIAPFIGDSGFRLLPALEHALSSARSFVGAPHTPCAIRDCNEDNASLHSESSSMRKKRAAFGLANLTGMYHSRPGNRKYSDEDPYNLRDKWKARLV